MTGWLDGLVERWPQMGPNLWWGTLDTLYMVGWSTFFTALFGLPLGVLLVTTDERGLTPAPAVRALLSAVVNVGRSLPFIVLMVAVLSLTRLLTGTTLGPTAAIVPLSIGAIPFYARLVETALREVGRDVVDAAQAMGARRIVIVGKVLLPEALPGLIAGLVMTVVTLVSYSAMAGAIGGGGLGDLAIRYGYQRFDDYYLWATVILLVLVVQVVQSVGDVLVRRVSHR
ncbi:ABC transporter permease [Thermobifida fusca]|jgi:D-methionine transport system permease protein|uniref:ABC transporter permease n=2 Tax=Thermobifida fusca TaxID=2021 RepID=A0A9P2TBN6_THEFU|nr:MULTISPECIES: methionine ABC transporter permease [Thermobifida]AAZ54970.1 putative ABC transporter permease protein [Thermobifida fusca YX]EOR71938.1 ABC transporter permease [Thermobifida fusca TM51]MBO2531041.1 ABC transporter permease [Thermobifida sp.]MDD6793129.1 ABC transporter permease [Thermobifida fusca]PPS92564.1 metal ABC transporter permease [Thermobifida fusca]